MFWEIEEPPTSEVHLTEDDQKAIDKFKNTVSRDPDGRYIVSLPRAGPKMDLGHSRQQALRRFYSNRKQLQKSDRWESFSEAVLEYSQLGHAEPVPIKELVKPDGENFYLPMHGVVKDHSKTTKLRVVFDASAKSSYGQSLNDQLLSGYTHY